MGSRERMWELRAAFFASGFIENAQLDFGNIISRMKTKVEIDN